VRPVALDVTDVDGLAAAADEVDSAFGRVDVLVNNAAIHYDTWQMLVNAVCPGWTATDMGGRGGRPVGEGAASILWAVDLPDDGPTGTFTRDGRPVPW
jgi:NAD(P)-dependent dehydrogenase (short-subunit alcohol dehydrogenase family)